MALAAPPDIVLVTIDTLRADHVGAYGATSGATPNLDLLARQGVLVEEAVVQVPQTRPSHASILTGLLPFEHGLRDNGSAPLPRRIPTLASSLKRAGYATAAFIAAYPVSRASGLDSGFDVFDDPFGGDADFLAGSAERNERPAREVVDAALRWMAKPSTRPRFIWLHFFEPHYPYEPEEPYASRYRRSPYDGEVATADAQLKRFLDRYPASATRLVAVTSDHGEGLGDHGEDEHHLFVYDSTLRVPLVVAGAGLPAGARLRGQFRSIDLLPTLMDLAGAPPPRVTGVSRARNLRSGAVIPDNQSYAESLYGALHFGYAPVRALRGEGFKYIDTPREELYRVASDPGETQNLADERGPLVAAMRAHLRELHGEAADRAANAAPVDPASLERLAALGYVSGGAPTAGPAPAGGLPDPKDRVAEYNRYSRAVNEAIAARRSGQPRDVIKALQPVAREFGGQYSVVSFLGEALLELHRFDEAVPYLAKARDAAPGAGPSWARLAEALAGAGRSNDALEASEQGLRVSPRYTDLIRLRAALLTRARRGGEAESLLEAAVKANPKDALLLAELSNLRRNAGDVASAEALSAQAVRLSPGHAEVWVSRGLTLGAMARADEAALAFARARELDPKNGDGWFYGAAIEIQRGRGDAALAFLSKVEELDPERPGLREARAAAQTGSASTAQPEGSIRLSILVCRTEAEAGAALRRIGSGEEFRAVAAQVSVDPSRVRGGDLGFVSASELREPLKTAVSGLKAGGVSGILATGRTFTIVKREK